MDTKIKISKLTAILLNTLIWRILEIVNSGPAALDYKIIKKLVEKLTQANQVLAELLNSSREGEFTKQLREFDSIRDDAFLGLRDYIESCTRRRNKPEIKEAAEKIYELFKKHGKSLQSLGYSAQTGATNLLLSDMRQPEMQTAIDKAKARELYKELEESQNAFETLYRKTLKTGKLKKKPTKKEIITVLKFDILLLIRNIIFAAGLDSEKYGETENRIAEAVDDIMIIAKNKNTRDKNLENEAGAA